MTEPPVLTRVEGHLGHVVLNRPRAINALDAEMVEIIQRTLDAWAADSRVRTVLISGAGDRGLCAGGDIRAIHADVAAGGAGAMAFFAAEYRLNATIADYPKPYVAWMDGLVMGGGLGVSAHGSLRLVTERSRLAMPEVGIGFHPDIGGSWLLSHAPGEIGTHLALTGGAIGAADAIEAGLADRYVPSARFGEVVEALAADEPFDLDEPPPGDFGTAREWIDVCYAGDSVAEIVERLAGHPHPGAQAAAKEIRTKSPAALEVTLRSLRTAATLPDLRAALDHEYRLSEEMLHHPDFAEGVRAQIIDKDRRPRWS